MKGWSFMGIGYHPISPGGIVVSLLLLRYHVKRGKPAKRTGPAEDFSGNPLTGHAGQSFARRRPGVSTGNEMYRFRRGYLPFAAQGRRRRTSTTRLGPAIGTSEGLLRVVATVAALRGEGKRW
jgi:hypothetical protein